LTPSSFQNVKLWTKNRPYQAIAEQLKRST